MTPPLRPQLARELELARLVDDQGALVGSGGFLPLGKPVVWPRVWVEADRLYYDDRDPRRPRSGPELGDGGGMLGAFVGLKDTSDVLAFAKRYGPLRLCEHGVPAAHDSRCRPRGSPERRSSGATGWDPIGRWLHFAGAARALLEIAALLHVEATGESAGAKRRRRDDRRRCWETVLADHPAGEQKVHERAAHFASSAQSSRWYLSQVLTEWLALGDVRLLFSWPAAQTAPELPTLGARSTFGLIAVQLALTIARADLARCDGCRRIDVVGEGRRKPAAGRRHFCSECGVRGGNRVRQRELRAQDRQIRELVEAGMAPAEAARQLQIPLARVRAATKRHRLRRRSAT